MADDLKSTEKRDVAVWHRFVLWVGMLLLGCYACTHIVGAGDTWVALACGKHFASHIHTGDKDVQLVSGINGVRELHLLGFGKRSQVSKGRGSHKPHIVLELDTIGEIISVERIDLQTNVGGIGGLIGAVVVGHDVKIYPYVCQRFVRGRL